MFDSNPLKKQLFTLVKLTKAEMEKRFSEAQVGITPLQYGVLSIIKKQPCTLNELARQFNMKAPSLVPVVDSLEHDGLLKRTDDERDRRKIQLTVTTKGQTILSKIAFDDKDDALNTAFNTLSSVKQKQLISLLQELVDNFPQTL